jgi:hypothetical protein
MHYKEIIMVFDTKSILSNKGAPIFIWIKKNTMQIREPIKRTKLAFKVTRNIDDVVLYAVVNDYQDGVITFFNEEDFEKYFEPETEFPTKDINFKEVVQVRRKIPQ